MPTVIHKKSTIKNTSGLRSCTLCKHEFLDDETYRVVEEDGPFDNDWYAICKRCLGTSKYDKFMQNNCN